MQITIATWNINSLRLRQSLLNHVMDGLKPDIICLQETKVPDELFPGDAPSALGFHHTAFRGMKGYNGVAILSRFPINRIDVAPDWCAKGDCRHIRPVVIHGHPRWLPGFRRFVVKRSVCTHFCTASRRVSMQRACQNFNHLFSVI